MTHPFGNDRFRFGSARFATDDEVNAAGMFTQQRTSLYCGELDGRPLWYDGDGGVLMVAGARSGKLRDILAYNICSGVLSDVTLLILDVRGELAAISRNQAPDLKSCIYWNPHALHGLPQHKINPLAHLRWSSPTLLSDTKLLLEGLLPKSGAAQSRYFELNARRIGEAIALALTRMNGQLTLPDLHDAVLLLQEGGDRWTDFAYEMHTSGIPLCTSVEAEIHAARADSSGGWKGIIGELLQALACLSDPVLRVSLSAPFDFVPSDLCSSEEPCQFYMMVPPELIEVYAPVIKALFSASMTLKSRAPQAPKQTWIIDEAARLTGFDQVVQLFTYGAGSGIRPVAVFQDIRQMRALSQDAEHIISSSAGLQLYFGVRDIDTARRVSVMLGSETLSYDDPVPQGRAALDVRKLMQGIFGGQNPFQVAFDAAQKRYESRHLTKQHRKLRTPEEVMGMPGDRLLIFADGLPAPLYAQRAPYWTRTWMAGRYHPNPYHPPLDEVSITTRRGRVISHAVIQEDVPVDYAHLPQYAGGSWSYIEGFRS